MPTSVHPKTDPSFEASPWSYDDQLIIAICIPIFLLNGVFILRYGFDNAFLSKKIFSIIEVSDATATTIGLVALSCIAIVIKKKQELKETVEPEESEKQKFVEDAKKSSKNLGHTQVPPFKKEIAKPAAKTSAPRKVSSSVGLSRYATISNRNRYSANSYDRNGSGVKMNCFFHSLLTSMMFENEEAASQNLPPPWNPTDFFPPNSTCTFQTASYEEYQFAANKLRSEFGNADLTEWTQGGFATTTNEAGNKVVGFYPKWALVKKTLFSFEKHLPRPTPVQPTGEFANTQDAQTNYQRTLRETALEQQSYKDEKRYEDPKFLQTFHRMIEVLKNLFPDLKKWDDVNKTYLEDGPTIWEEYQGRWYYEYDKVCYINNNTAYIDGHIAFMRNLCASLKPLSDGYVIPAHVAHSPQDFTKPPVLFEKHFSELGEEALNQKIEWFSCLEQTLIENIEAHCISAPEVHNQAFQVPSGFVRPATILTFLQKHCVAGTQMSLLGCSRANIRFNREIVYFKHNQAPAHVNSSHNQLPCFYIYNSGAHWTGVERVKAAQLASNSSQLLVQAEALQRGARKDKLKRDAEIQ